MKTGGWDEVKNDWRVAGLVLQIIAEQGPGMAVAQEQSAEDAALAATRRALGA